MDKSKEIENLKQAQIGVDDAKAIDYKELAKQDEDKKKKDCLDSLNMVLNKYGFDLISQPPQMYVTSDGTIKMGPSAIILVPKP